MVGSSLFSGAQGKDMSDYDDHDERRARYARGDAAKAAYAAFVQELDLFEKEVNAELPTEMHVYLTCTNTDYQEVVALQGAADEESAEFWGEMLNAAKGRAIINCQFYNIETQFYAAFPNL